MDDVTSLRVRLDRRVDPERVAPRVLPGERVEVEHQRRPAQRLTVPPAELHRPEEAVLLVGEGDEDARARRGPLGPALGRRDHRCDAGGVVGGADAVELRVVVRTDDDALGSVVLCHGSFQKNSL